MDTVQLTKRLANLYDIKFIIRNQSEEPTNLNKLLETVDNYIIPLEEELFNNLLNKRK